MNEFYAPRGLPAIPDSAPIFDVSPLHLQVLARAGRLSLRDMAVRLARDGAADLVSYDDACQHLNDVSMWLQSACFVLSPRRGAQLLKDALFTLHSAWTSPRYEHLPPPGVPAGQYFRVDEAIELVGSTVRTRPEVKDADHLRVALVWGILNIYPGQWMICLAWDRMGGSFFFDRKDLETVIVVDEPISSKSIWPLEGLDNSA
ncbi:MAG: hypothetical protein FJZ97_12335 [Chloroflexi bacterium]|nr:hypothetical protein [Chloroflexota bacterium]